MLRRASPYLALGVVRTFCGDCSDIRLLRFRFFAGLNQTEGQIYRYYLPGPFIGLRAFFYAHQSVIFPATRLIAIMVTTRNEHSRTRTVLGLLRSSTIVFCATPPHFPVASSFILVKFTRENFSCPSFAPLTYYRSLIVERVVNALSRLMVHYSLLNRSVRRLFCVRGPVCEYQRDTR